VVIEGADPNDPTRTIRTVTYHGYVNEDGLILNGTESADYDASQVVVHDVAAITVTDAEGKKRGSLTANATVNPFQLSLTGFITSELDGDVQTLPDLEDAQEAQQSA
jgi:hypothetical protein